MRVHNYALNHITLRVGKKAQWTLSKFWEFSFFYSLVLLVRNKVMQNMTNPDKVRSYCTN